VFDEDEKLKIKNNSSKVPLITKEQTIGK